MKGIFKIAVSKFFVYVHQPVDLFLIDRLLYLPGDLEPRHSSVDRARCFTDNADKFVFLYQFEKTRNGVYASGVNCCNFSIVDRWPHCATKEHIFHLNVSGV